MFDNPAPADAAPQPPAETRAERRMRKLEQMSDMGLDIGRRLTRQAELASAHAETEAVPDNLPHARRLDEIARSFAQVSRAVSVAMALEDRIDQGLPALPDLDRARRLREQAAREKRAAATSGVERSFSLDDVLTNPKRLVRLKLDLDRLLDAELLDLDAFLDRPLPQIIERLRRNLGLDPIEDEAELWAEAPVSAPSPTPGLPREGGDPGSFVHPQRDTAEHARHTARDARPRAAAHDGKTPGSPPSRGRAELIANAAAPLTPRAVRSAFSSTSGPGGFP